MGVEMLYRAVIGPVLPTHPEMDAFIEGFRLDTDSGFSMVQASNFVVEVIISKLMIDSSVTSFKAGLKPC